MSRAWLAPVILLMVQSAPVAVVQDTSGRRYLAIGAAAGSYVNETVTCAGDVTDRQRVRQTGLGIEASLPVTAGFSIRANAGSIGIDQEGPVRTEYYGGTYAGVMAAYDVATAGIGFGIERQPGPASSDPYGKRLVDERIIPHGFLRVGRESRTAVHLEVGGPAAPGLPTDMLRLGVTRHWNAPDRLGFRLDLGAAEFPQNHGESYQAQLRLPSHGAFSLRVAGQLRPANGGNVGVIGTVRW